MRIVITLMLLLGTAAFCFAADKTTAKDFVTEPPTLLSLGFEWHIDGDDNRNATVAVSYRKKGEQTWKEGLPLLRIGGFYFALATLGINFVFFDFFHNLAPRVEGSEGLYGLQLPDLLASSAPRFATTVAVAIACALLCQAIVTSSLGRALRATRDRPDALAALGKDPRRYQVLIWTFAAGLTGLAGGLYAATLFYIDPTLFTLDASILVLVYIGVGGLASTTGSVLGVILLIAFNESLRFLGLPSQFVGPFQQAIYGLLLILLMIFRRRGLVGKYDFTE